MPSPIPHIFIIAGEASGDTLGARLMKALSEETADKIRFSGVGGTQMSTQGLESIFPMSDLSVMGFTEVVKHIPNLLRRMRQTVTAIKACKPDMVITIDSPDFNFRIAKRLQSLRNTCHLPLVHYVAPSVWAYRRKRAKKIAALYDHLFTLLPFEPPYFAPYGLSTTVVGHPIVETPPTYQKNDIEQFRKRFAIAEDQAIITMMPGSRVGEVTRHLPIFTEAITSLGQKGVSLQLIIPTVAHLHDTIKAFYDNSTITPIIIDNTEDKRLAFHASNVALVKSGTGVLELAMMNIPMIVAYKVSACSAWIAKRLLTIKHFSLINIILKREVIPEYIQERCTPTHLAHGLDTLLHDETARQMQKDSCNTALAQLGKGDTHSPSQKAATAVMRLLAEITPQYPET